MNEHISTYTNTDKKRERWSKYKLWVLRERERALTFGESCGRLGVEAEDDIGCWDENRATTHSPGTAQGCPQEAHQSAYNAAPAQAQFLLQQPSTYTSHTYTRSIEDLPL